MNAILGPQIGAPQRNQLAQQVSGLQGLPPAPPQPLAPAIPQAIPAQQTQESDAIGGELRRLGVGEDSFPPIEDAIRRNGEIRPDQLRAYGDLPDEDKRRFWDMIRSNPGVSIDDALTPQGADNPRGLFYQEGRNSVVPGGQERIYRVGGVAEQPAGAAPEVAAAPDVAPLGKAATTDLEKREIAARDSMARFGEIEQMVARNPEVLDVLGYRGRARMEWLKIKDKIYSGDLSEDDMAQLDEGTRFVVGVMSSVNRAIKEMTGAQLSNEEADRLMKSMPNMDMGPGQFQAALGYVSNQSQLAIMRYNYWRNNGLQGLPEDMVGLDNMEGFLKQRGAELYQAAIDQGYTRAEARAVASQAMSREFGNGG